MLKVNSVSFAYHRQPVIEDISFELPKGGYLALLGESGSGKSTLLKAIYGMLHLETGEISWNNQKVLGPNYALIPGESYMKFVSQELDLMPFTTVVENIAEFLPPFHQESHDSRIVELLDVIQMSDFADVKIKDLSGGQKQRVAIARALAQEPEVLLMDEPFSSIDQFKKNTLRQSLFPYLKDQGITVITATHDPDDVLPYAWMAMIIQAGKIVDFGPMQQIYNAPKNLYVASLFGEAVTIPLYLLQPDYLLDTPIVVYPHELATTTSSALTVTVQNSFFKGGYYLIKAVHDTDLRVAFNHAKPIIPGTKVALKIAMESLRDRINAHHG